MPSPTQPPAQERALPANAASPADLWMARLSAEAADGRFANELGDRMRLARLTFGGRLLCPFLMPLLVDERHESLVRNAAETLAALAERIGRLALESPDIMAQLAPAEVERPFFEIDPGYRTITTAGRADAFLADGRLHFAEFNGESPAGPGYSQRLNELFDALPVTESLREHYTVRHYRPIERLLEALLASYREWGGTASPPMLAIVDWRELPTVTEFEILRDTFTALGVPSVVVDPRDLEIAGDDLVAEGRRIDLVYRRVVTPDILARPDECRALVEACRRRLACVANTFRCKLPHKKALFAVLTDERNAALFSPVEQETIRNHIPWTRLLRPGHTTRNGRRIDLLEDARRRRGELVLKPNDEYGGTGVTLGWELDQPAWERALNQALADERAWVLQDRIPVARAAFPAWQAVRPPVTRQMAIVPQEMLVDFAPYVFRGRLAGFLSRLSATGLVNISSGGGQVPTFIVGRKGRSVANA